MCLLLIVMFILLMWMVIWYWRCLVVMFGLVRILVKFMFRYWEVILWLRIYLGWLGFLCLMVMCVCFWLKFLWRIVVLELLMVDFCCKFVLMLLLEFKFWWIEILRNLCWLRVMLKCKCNGVNEFLMMVWFWFVLLVS